jgi:hypothetical protein
MDYLTVKLDPSAICILLAVLALWAQLWVGYSKAKSVERQRVVTIGLVWIYCAIFFGFIAIIASVLESRGTVETIRINIEGICFVTSLVMGLISVGESVVTLAMKLKSGKTHDELSGISEENYRKSFYYIVILVSLILMGAILDMWFAFAGPIIWIIALVVGLLLLHRIRYFGDHFVIIDKNS